MANNYKDSAEYKAYNEAFGAGDQVQQPIPTSFDMAMEQTGLGVSDKFGMPLQPAPNLNTPVSDLPLTTMPTTSTSGYNYKKLLLPAVGILALYLLFKKK